MESNAKHKTPLFSEYLFRTMFHKNSLELLLAFYGTLPESVYRISNLYDKRNELRRESHANKMKCYEEL